MEASRSVCYNRSRVGVDIWAGWRGVVLWGFAGRGWPVHVLRSVLDLAFMNGWIMCMGCAASAEEALFGGSSKSSPAREFAEGSDGDGEPSAGIAPTICPARKCARVRKADRCGILVCAGVPSAGTASGICQNCT